MVTLYAILTDFIVRTVDFDITKYVKNSYYLNIFGLQ